MSNTLTQSAVITVVAAATGTATYTMPEGNWEVFKIDGYLTAQAGASADITVNNDGTAMSGAMLAPDGSALANADPIGFPFIWSVPVSAQLSLSHGTVITVVTVAAASIVHLHIKRV